MALATYTLTIDLVNIQAGGVEGVSVGVALESQNIVYPIVESSADTNTQILYPTTLSGSTGENGIHTFTLMPSSDYNDQPGVGNYVVTVGSYTRTITMPASNVRLADIGDAVPAGTAGLTTMDTRLSRLVSDLSDSEKESIQAKLGIDDLGGGGTALLYDTSFPAESETGSWIVFSADVASGLTWKDTDGTSDLTSADAGDTARYNGANWVKVGSLAPQDIPDPDIPPAMLYDTSFPGSPESGTWFIFSDDVANGLTWKDTDGTSDLTSASAGDAARYDGTDWVKIGSFADQTIPDAYTLPDATEAIKGGVKGATSAQASGASGTTVLAWTNNRLRQLVTAALPSGSTSEAQGTTSVRRIWTPAKLREAANTAIHLLVPAVFRTGDTNLIPVSKLGSGVRDGSTYLKGDGTFGTGPTPAAGSALNSVALTKVGNTVTISGTSSTGPAFSDLSDVIWLHFEYDRVNPDIEFNTLVLKSQIEGLAVGGAKKLQLQGGGGGYGNIYDVGGNLTFGVFDAQYTNVTCEVYKLTGSAADAVSGITETEGDARYLQLSGGTLTGLITLSGAPTADLHPATKKYVDDMASGGSNVPDKPTVSTGTKRYELVIPASGTAYWVETAEGVWHKVADVPSSTETLPFGIDFNSSDVLYLTGSGRDRVHSWDGSAWSRVTDAPSAEGNPRDVAFNSDDVLYLVGNGSDDVWSYDGSTWTKFADAPTTETIPRSIAFDSSDTLHLTGTVTDDVWSYNGSTWSKVADAPNGEHTPTTIAFDSNDTLYLIGQATSDVWKWNGSTWSKAFDIPASETMPTGIAFDSNDVLYLVGQTLDDVWKYVLPESGGTTVEANPSGGADGGDLTKIGIDGTIYDLAADAASAPAEFEVLHSISIDITNSELNHWHATGHILSTSEKTIVAQLNNATPTVTDRNLLTIPNPAVSYVMGGTTPVSVGVAREDFGHAEGDYVRLTFNNVDYLFGRTSNNELLVASTGTSLTYDLDPLVIGRWKGGKGDQGDPGPAYDDTALHDALDRLDVPEVVGDFADADADDLAAGYGVYPSADGTFSDSDFVLSGSTPAAGTNRFFIRTPKHASRYGARIVLNTTPAQTLPDNDPLEQEHLVKVTSRPDDAQDGYDYFFVGVTHDDAPIQDANVNTYKLQVAPVTQQEIINIGYWQDSNQSPNVAPTSKSIATVRAGEMFPIVFPAKNRPRNLHFALAAGYDITALYIAGSSALTDFSKVAESRLANFWHSARIRNQDEISCLIKIERT